MQLRGDATENDNDEAMDTIMEEADRQLRGDGNSTESDTDELMDSILEEADMQLRGGRPPTRLVAVASSSADPQEPMAAVMAFDDDPWKREHMARIRSEIETLLDKPECPSKLKDIMAKIVDKFGSFNQAAIQTMIQEIVLQGMMQSESRQ